MSWRVVDLGAKEGDAINTFLRGGHRQFREKKFVCKPGECLAVEVNDKYKAKVKSRGYHFLSANVLGTEFVDANVDYYRLRFPDAADFAWPAADYYLAGDFLEHLPSRGASDYVLRRMLQSARCGVMVDIPNFDQDTKTGEGVLRALGLRFTWTNWVGHPSHYLKADVLSVLNEVTPNAPVKYKAKRMIADSSSHFVVPADAPIDTNRYVAKLGAKPVVTFKPPLIGGHVFYVRLTQ